MTEWKKWKCKDCGTEFLCVTIETGGDEICDSEPDHCIGCGSWNVEEDGMIEL